MKQAAAVALSSGATATIDGVRFEISGDDPSANNADAFSIWLIFDIGFAIIRIGFKEVF